MPRLTRIWDLNGYKLMAGEQFDTGERHHRNGTLIIDHTTYSSQGVLRCIIQSDAGNDEASVFLVIKHAPPLIHKISRSPIRTAVGSTVEMVCQADGIPQPRIVWRIPSNPLKNLDLKNSGQKFPESSIKINNTQLTIHNASPMDSGNYSCIAETQLGERDSKSVELIVLSDRPPHIYNISMSRNKNDYTTAELICQATGQPEPSISWIKPKHLVEVEILQDLIQYKEYDKYTGNLLIKSKIVFTAHGLAKTDTGTFTCEAKNKFGTSDAEVTLNKFMEVKTLANTLESLIGLPGANKDGVIENVVEKLIPIDFRQNQDAYLTCRHGHAQISNNYEWKYPNGKIHVQDDWRYSVIGVGVLRIRSVQPKHEGKYVCTVKRLLSPGVYDIYKTVNILNVITGLDGLGYN